MTPSGDRPGFRHGNNSATRADPIRSIQNLMEGR